MLIIKIRKDLKQAILNRDEDRKFALRIVLGEIPRLNKKAKEIVTDQEIEAIIRKLIKSEIEVITLLSLKGSKIDTSPYINILKEYIPKLMTEDEISNWISENVNMDDFIILGKAMGFIMKSLKGKVDGNMVKNILLKKEM